MYIITYISHFVKSFLHPIKKRHARRYLGLVVRIAVYSVKRHKKQRRVLPCQLRRQDAPVPKEHSVQIADLAARARAAALYSFFADSSSTYHSHT